MKILLTGGAGFVGSHVADRCVAAGHDVVVVDDLSAGKRELIHPRATFYLVDIRSPAITEVFDRERPQIVCHLAARTNVRESMEKPLLYADVNVLGSLRLLECCRRYKVRKVVYASTGGAAYGEAQCLPVREEHPINPLDPYGASKHHVEHYLFLYRCNYGLDFTVLRYANVFGPRQDPSGEAGVVAIFALNMLTGRQPVINGSGDQVRDYVYVGDVAAATLTALKRGSGGTYNIGSGTGTSVSHIFDLLAGLTGYAGKRVNGPAKRGEVFRIYLDATKARVELGWAARTGLEEGLGLTVTHFREKLQQADRGSFAFAG